MLNKTNIALAAALIAVSVTAALANDSGANDRGGYVVPGSTVGVNPVYHHRYAHHVPNYSRPSDTYGYVPTKHHVADKPTQDAR
jgi:hexokinase